MLSDMVLDYVRQAYKSGKTQDDIARELHISHTVINRLLSGKRNAGKLYLETFDRMFPAATVSLFGGGVSIAGDNRAPVAAGGSTQHVGHNFFAPAGAPPEVAAVLSSTLTPAEKAAILRALYHPESEVQK